MTSKRYTGNIITDTPTDPTGDAAGGVWSLAEANAFKAGNAWPTLPEAPTIGTATAVVTGQSASVTFTAGDLNGGTLTEYVATSDPSGITGTGTTSPVTVSGLTNGTSYTFTVKATTGAGTGPESGSSNSVTANTGDIGIIAGGASSSFSFGRTNIIQYVNIASTGNSSDWGDLTVARWGVGSGSSSTRAVFAYGESSSTNTNIIDYISLTSQGNAADFGDMGATKDKSSGASNSTYAVFSRQNVSSGAYDYVTIASTGNSTSWGNAQRDTEAAATCASTTYGFWAGGTTATQDIEYITWSSTGNSVGWGTLGNAASLASGCSSSTRGLVNTAFNGTNVLNTIEYFSLASTGNGSDFGDLTAVRDSIGEATSSGTRGIFSGGYISSSATFLKSIDYVTIATTGNASDFGDLVANNANHASTSNCHGGL